MKLIVEGRELEREKGVKLSELAEELGGADNEILLATVNGRLKELWKPVEEDAEIRFLTIDSKDGRRAYERALIFVMIKAVHDSFPYEKIERVSVEYSIGNGLYCELHGAGIEENMPLPADMIETIRARMEELIAENQMF